ncbi:MAG TPA: AMP-binding protein [Acidimicrobiales bacterium]|nr:AMP-binding protein [Acidimicrobiales bacterium]
MDVAYTRLFDLLADSYGDREALVWRDRRQTFTDVRDQANRFANVLAAHGLGLRADPDQVAPHVSPHDHVALYLRNGTEYLIAMLGAWRARAAATNINYRYVDDELAGVLADQDCAAIVYHGSFAGTLARVLQRIEAPRLLLRVDDGAGDELLPGALDYDEALAGASGAAPPRDDHSPSDRYVLYTGGTTGAPKGVLWRQGDFLVKALGLRHGDGSEFTGPQEVLVRAGRRRLASMPLPPFMHGAAHWNALSTWLSAGTVVLPDEVTRFDPVNALAVAARERVTATVIVGDAFARPLADALDAGAPVPHELRHVLSSGAILSRPVAERLRAHLPEVRLLDVLGSSEAGRQALNSTAPGEERRTEFGRDRGTVVLDEDRNHVLEPGDDRVGWVATSGRVPMGYLGDPAKTAATFPTIDGVRYVVPGDRARLTPDGAIELHGRESVTINSGGEKIFAEEVERAVKEHASVADVLVVPRPSEKWGSEVVAIVALHHGGTADPEALKSTARAHIAGFKIPKDFVFVDDVPRFPSGKPDYSMAKALAAAKAAAAASPTSD